MRNVLFTAFGLILVLSALAVWFAGPIDSGANMLEYATIKVGFPALALTVGVFCLIRPQLARWM